MIGFFDSGIGGLTVVKEVLKKLPSYQILYLGDTARLPYGNRSQELIYQFTQQGVDFLFMADDIAYKSGLFIRPEIFKPMWLPKLKRIFEPVLNAGLPILFHSDGNLDEIIEDLIDAGINCLHPMDPYGINYREYKKRYGNRVALCGNIDIEYPLVRGTAEDVERDVKEHMEVLKLGGRWVAGSSHSIVNYIPHENFVAMINAIHKYGLY